MKLHEAIELLSKKHTKLFGDTDPVKRIIENREYKKKKPKRTITPDEATIYCLDVN